MVVTIVSYSLDIWLYIHRVREKNGPPKQNAVKCTVYNTIQ